MGMARYYWNYRQPTITLDDHRFFAVSRPVFVPCKEKKRPSRYYCVSQCGPTLAVSPCFQDPKKIRHYPSALVLSYLGARRHVIKIERATTSAGADAGSDTINHRQSLFWPGSIVP
jgi:hypothetical protein